MNREKIFSRVDHTLLDQSATWEEIKEILDDGLKYKVASACIPPSFVKRAKDYVGNDLAICTVIGFPNGYNTSEVKIFETKNAIKNGADEIDMVINIGALKEKKYVFVLEEIRAIYKACEGKILKVIVENCLLNEEEKIKICEIVSEAEVEYIKTSTGFSTGGATFEDVQLMRKNIGAEVKIKAAGGISSFEDAKKFLELGVDRLGTSRLVKLQKNAE